MNRRTSIGDTPALQSTEGAAGVIVPAAPERVEVGRLVFPAASDEYGDPEIDAFMGRIEAVQERLQKETGARIELPVFVEVPTAGVTGRDGQTFPQQSPMGDSEANKEKG